MLNPFIMELDILDKIKNDSKHQIVLSDPYKLKKLVGELEEAFVTGPSIDYNSLQRFNCYNKNKYNPFGYDQRKGKKLKNKRSFYRRNCLRHKLIRIRKEFNFVKRNIVYYQELTLREKEIIQLLANGNNNPEIAERLFISRCTVEQHRKHINHKLKIRSFPHLMDYCYAFDLV